MPWAGTQNKGSPLSVTFGKQIPYTRYKGKSQHVLPVVRPWQGPKLAFRVTR